MAESDLDRNPKCVERVSEIQALKDRMLRLENYNNKRVVGSIDNDEDQREVLKDLLVSLSMGEREVEKSDCQIEFIRLCLAGVIRSGTLISDPWEDGHVLKDLDIKIKKASEAIKLLEEVGVSALKRKRSDDGTHAEGERLGLIVKDDIHQDRLASKKGDMEALTNTRFSYLSIKRTLMNRWERIKDQEASRFRNFKMIDNRYLLLNQIGRGGFGEVYKGYDFEDNVYVACKLHEFNPQWDEEWRKNYAHHVTREFKIHRDLVHDHIVRHLDTVHIDDDSFCTILEYCSGKDLNDALKLRTKLPEHEAKIILYQIFLALVYLNECKTKIIHYDLKPANVLFHGGVAKVGDFGLSKWYTDDFGLGGMELTSQGAGTKWYLPPECFDRTKTPVITPNVDVWSAGIMFYQMLYGRFPFGDTRSSESYGSILMKNPELIFPAEPPVSDEAKNFIRRCLTFNQAKRPDVLAIARHPYLIIS